MKASHLVLISVAFVVVLLAVSWCKPGPKSPTGGGTPSVQQSPPPPAGTPTVWPSPSLTPEQFAATPANQTPPPDFSKTTEKVRPAVILVTIFDSSGRLLRNGTGFFISQDGRFITNWHFVDGGEHAVAKSADGKIRNVSGVLASSAALDLALLKADTKTGVPFLPLSKDSAPQIGTPVAVIGSPLGGREQPLATATISTRRSDQSRDRLEISAPLSADAGGSPVVDVNGVVLGVVASQQENGAAANVVRTSTTLDLFLATVEPNTAAYWPKTATKPSELAEQSPSATPSPKASVQPSGQPAKLVYNPAPKYPTEARFSNLKGSGRYRVIFDAGGQVRDVQIVESTGKVILDQSALASLRQWKSEPGREWSIVVPITFHP